MLDSVPTIDIFLSHRHAFIMIETIKENNFARFILNLSIRNKKGTNFLKGTAKEHF